MGYSPWGHNESDVTDRITLASVTRKAQVKTTIKCHFPPTRMAIIKTETASSAGGEVEKRGTSMSLVGMRDGTATLQSSLALSQTVKHTVILLLLLLSHFSCVRLCATPQTAAHQAPPSLGFSRQEHWSGLPLPSPMHLSEK